MQIASMPKVVFTMKPNQLWNYYGSLKDMMNFLTLIGLFSPCRNPHASVILKIVSVMNCVIRLAVNITILCVFASSLIIFGNEKIVSHAQGMIYGFYNLVNVIFIMTVNLHPKGVNLMDKIKEQNKEEDRKVSRRIFKVLFSVHLFCFVLISVIRSGFLYSEKERKAFIVAFFPFNDHNSTESYVCIALFLVFLPSGEYFSAMYYNYTCLLISERYKLLWKELKEITEQKDIIESAIQGQRMKYKDITETVEKLNCLFAIYVSFNIGTWMLMICALTYLAITKFILSYAIYIVTLNVLLFLLLFTSSLLFTQVSKPNI